VKTPWICCFALALSGPLAITPSPALAQARLFGTDESPPPGAPPSGPRVVMRLEYTPAAGCPDDQVLRATISAQVRQWDPFAPNAPWRLVVGFSRRGSVYVGAAELRDVTGAVPWTRALAPRGRCLDLIEDLAVTLALHLNPPAPPASAMPASAVPGAPTSWSPAPAPASAPPSRSTRATLRLGLGTWMDLATAPRPAFGVSADLGVRVAWFSLAGELRWGPPAGASAMDGIDITTSLLTGALVPCGHVGWFAGCLIGELGQFRGSATTTKVTPDHRTVLYGRAGARLSVEIPAVADRLFVRLSANLLGAPVPPKIWLAYSGKAPQKAPQIEWESPGFTGGLGAGLVASF